MHTLGPTNAMKQCEVVRWMDFKMPDLRDCARYAAVNSRYAEAPMGPMVVARKLVDGPAQNTVSLVTSKAIELCIVRRLPLSNTTGSCRLMQYFWLELCPRQRRYLYQMLSCLWGSGTLSPVKWLRQSRSNALSSVPEWHPAIP
jgi:hypothetical protein